MDRAEAIQAVVVVYFQHCHCLSVSVCSVDQWRNQGADWATARGLHHLGAPIPNWAKSLEEGGAQ